MGAAAATEEAEATAPAPEAAKKKGKLPIIIGAVVALAAAGGGAYFMMGKKSGSEAGHEAPAAEHGGSGGHDSGKSDEHGKEGASGSSQYLTLTPAFVVNLEDTEAARYLQVEMELSASDSKALDAAKTHMPRIRNALLLLLGSRKVSDLASREGKEKLQADVLAEVQKVMTEVTGKPQIDAVYFNSFVMQ